MQIFSDSLFIFFMMILMHLVADYTLQGWLASAKQKEWWKSQNGYSKKYSNDYLAGLICHSTYWSILIMLPIMISDGRVRNFTYFALLINLVIHAIIDDLKCNKKKINLCQDQLFHLAQILITWFIWVSICMHESLEHCMAILDECIAMLS